MLPYSKNSLHICSLIKMDEPLQRSTIAFIFGVFDFYLVFTFSWEEEISLKKKKKKFAGARFASFAFGHSFVT